MAHNLNFHTSDCHTLQLGKQKKANSVIVENHPLKEQNNLRKAWFKKEVTAKPAFMEQKDSGYNLVHNEPEATNCAISVRILN